MPAKKPTKKPTKPDKPSTPKKEKVPMYRKRGLPPWLIPGNPGNKGGTGRPANAIRFSYGELAGHDGLLLCQEVINDPKASRKDRLHAVELSARIARLMNHQDVPESTELPAMTIVGDSEPPPEYPDI